MTTHPGRTPQALRRVFRSAWENALSGQNENTGRPMAKVRDVIKMIEDDGWSVVRQRGSHRQFKHASKPGLVTVAGKPGDDMAAGTLNSVLKQAGLKQ